MAPKVVTFGEMSDQWLDAKGVEWKPTYRRAQAQRLRDYALPKIGKLAVAAVKVEHVTEVLDQLWSSHPNSASLLRMQLEQILDFSKIKGYRDGDNPARWKGHLKHVYGKVTKLRAVKRKAMGKEEHHAAMDYRGIGAFMAKIRGIDNDVTVAALEFTILTAARTSETVGAVWDEIDLDARTWVIPAARMGKNGKEQRIPLSDRAVAILGRMAEIRIDSRVFPGLGQWAMLPILQGRLGCLDLTVHGFRSSFRDWAGEQTNFPRELAEAALAH